ncbi:hypothetical protein MXMO3_01712 [Maritalea myrionectae]|uniref:N-acetyltransferase domain-containing protein n=1 Tax=Maritalea myrionectae TaxID=454601 RepID=A0A2R4MDX1_9HYPH|nr:hypothetical protein [Maritalea myrionectae]AVX04238.1 hypothetical protein MXMO3_01712 [Maritalea myrionectae]
MGEIVKLVGRSGDILGDDLDAPIFGYASISDGVDALGGLAWIEGKCWMWFSSAKPQNVSALHVVRCAKQLLRRAVQVGEMEVYTPRDAQFATSSRLLKLVGFKLAYTESGKEIYVWQA